MTEQEKILLRATKENGALEQCFMAQEEAGELIQAINKLRRAGGINFYEIIPPGKTNKTSSIKYALAYNQLCGEVADMEIILGQMRSMLRGEQIDLIKDRKISRLEKRLDKKKGGKSE